MFLFGFPSVVLVLCVFVVLVFFLGGFPYGFGSSRPVCLVLVQLEPYKPVCHVLRQSGAYGPVCLSWKQIKP